VAKYKKQYLTSKPDYTLLTLDNENHRQEMYKTLHYIQHELMPKQLSKAVLLYAKNHDEYDQKLLRLLADCWLAVAGKYAHIVNKGGVLPEDYQVGLDRMFGEMIERAKIVKAEKDAAKEVEDKKATGPVLTVQDRMRMQAEDLGATFDVWLDDLLLGKVKSITKEMDPGKYMTLANFKAGQARWLRSFYEPELALLKEVQAGKDAQLVEGYNNISKSSLLRTIKLLDRIITATAMIETVSKATRKTRKKKAPSVEKLVANVKYCARNDEFGIASVSPLGIVGAQEVWVFNIKTRKLGKYVAQDTAGLTIKGTTIKDFTTTSSVAKNLRKPKDQLKDFMSAGKVKLRKFLGEIKAVEIKMNGRLSKDVVILKIVK